MPTARADYVLLEGSPGTTFVKLSALCPDLVWPISFRDGKQDPG